MKLKLLTSGLLVASLVTLAPVSLVSAEEQDTSAESESYEHGHRHEMRKKFKKRHEKFMVERMKKIDSNGDGNVDLQEYLTHAEQRFNEMDINGDQSVTADEAREAHKMMRKKHHKAFKEAHKEHGDDESGESKE